jgi:YggT family protein
VQPVFTRLWQQAQAVALGLPRRPRRTEACQLPPSRVNSRVGERFGGPMRAILDVILLVLDLYTWVIILAAVLSWLIAFNVVNMYSDVVRSIWNVLTALTEPLLRPIRQFMPNFGGLDISPVILLLLIFFIRNVINLYIYPNVF